MTSSSGVNPSSRSVYNEFIAVKAFLEDQQDIQNLTTRVVSLENYETTAIEHTQEQDTEITALQGTAVALQSQIDTEAADITTLQGQIGTINSDISTIQSTLATQGASIATNAFNISTLQSQMTTANTNISNNTASIVANTADIVSLQSQIGTINTNITSLQTQVNTNTTNIAQNTLDITSLYSGLLSNATAIAAANTRITTANQGNFYMHLYTGEIFRIKEELQINVGMSTFFSSPNYTFNPIFQDFCGSGLIISNIMNTQTSPDTFVVNYKFTPSAVATNILDTRQGIYEVLNRLNDYGTVSLVDKFQYCVRILADSSVVNTNASGSTSFLEAVIMYNTGTTLLQQADRTDPNKQLIYNSTNIRGDEAMLLSDFAQTPFFPLNTQINIGYVTKSSLSNCNLQATSNIQFELVMKPILSALN